MRPVRQWSIERWTIGKDLQVLKREWEVYTEQADGSVRMDLQANRPTSGTRASVPE